MRKILKRSSTRVTAIALLTLTVLLAPKLAQTQVVGDVPTRQIELWAASGTVAVPGGTVPIWGFTDTDPAGDPAGSATLPGPVLRARQGEEVTVTLHNTLDRNVSFMGAGLSLAPDTQGIAPNDTKSYTFIVDKPGTFLYESGVDPQRQSQMGLHGALVVDSNSGGQAYDDPATAYDREAVMVLGEIDPTFHADPDGFDLRRYAPKHFLINGKSYPETQNVPAGRGQKVLFRYVNAGYKDHTLQVLGMDQTVVAADANLLKNPLRTFSHTVAPGETYDLVSTIPASAEPGNLFALRGTGIDAAMMTFIEVP